MPSPDQQRAQQLAPPPAWREQHVLPCPMCRISLTFKRTAVFAREEASQRDGAVAPSSAHYAVRCDRCDLDITVTMTERLRPRGNGVWEP